MKNKGLLLYFVLISLLLSGCGKKELSKQVVVTINDEKVYMDEVIWELFLYEYDLYEDSKDYEKENGKSYWQIDIGDGVTVGDALKEEVINDIIFTHILSGQAKKTGSFVIEDNGGYDEIIDKDMALINDKLEDYGMTREGCRKLIETQGLFNYYLEEILKKYEVDEDKIREENPYDKDTYETKKNYNEYIDSLIKDAKMQKLTDEYNNTLLGMYDVKINDEVWDAYEVGELTKMLDNK